MIHAFITLRELLGGSLFALCLLMLFFIGTLGDR